MNERTNEAGQQGADQVVKEDVTTESSPQEQPQVGKEGAPWEDFSEVTQEEVTEAVDDGK